MHMRWIFALYLIGIALQASGQNSIGTGAVAELYQQYCAACHGEELRGGLGSNLVDEEWIYGNQPEEIATVIREGIPSAGMVPYGGILSDEQILSLVIYLKEMGQLAKAETVPPASGEGGIFTSRHHGFQLEKVAHLDGDIFWSVEFLPDGALLLTQFGGQLFIARDGQLGDPIKGIPESHRHGQGGLLEAVPHPEYADNG